MTIKHLLRGVSILFAALCFTVASNTWAEEQKPDQVIDQASKQILSAIEPRKDELRKDSAQLYKIVEDIITPHFDFETISKRVLGKAWKDASEAQRSRFSEAFKDLLIRTYSNALLEYSGEEIKWQSITPGSKPDRVTQQAEVTLANGQSIPMNWGLRKIGDNWKVYDISIDGISLVTNYRSVFASEVRKNGLDALIERLESKNATSS